MDRPALAGRGILVSKHRPIDLKLAPNLKAGNPGEETVIWPRLIGKPA
jgi:hypothetical protein